MSAHDRLATALEAVVGAEWLLTETATTDYAIDGMAPALVAVPEDEEQIAAVLRLAEEHQASVFPHGSGSHLGLGNQPSTVDLVLSLRRLNAQLAYEPGDMTTTVQAGMRLADLQTTLGQNNQFLALDPSAAATTTVGGIVAANLSGPRRHLYGSARDLLLGSTVISMNGKRTKAGGRVVKNVTGYDLNKLYIGSLGTLAVISELTWKLHPMPQGERTIAIGVTDQADLHPISQQLLKMPLRLNSLTVLNATCAQQLATQLDQSLPDTAYCVLARVEGHPQVTKRQQTRLTDAIQHLPLLGAATPQTWPDSFSTPLWQGIAELPLTLAAQDANSVISKVSLQLANVPRFFHEMQTISKGADQPWPVFAHAGTGIAYVQLPSTGSEASAPSVMLNQVQALDASVAQLNGRRVLEHAPASIKQQCDVWGPPGDEFALMQAIKTSFDPHNRLNPGRFLGGL